MATRTAPPEESDIQGLARFGYGKLVESCFLLVNIGDAAAARAWLAVAPVSDAAVRPSAPYTAMQIAFTSAGLRALGVPGDVLAGFSAEFLDGMSAESRARRLGDVGPSAPAAWSWGGAAGEPHALVMLYGQEGRLAAFREGVERDLRAAGLRVAAALATSNLDGVEPFGFTDGISQPEVDWKRRLAQDGGDRTRYGNVMELGELLLGYPNAYGKYTDRPILPRSRGGGTPLPLAEDAPDRLDLGRNGTYLVFRQLHQDVRGFWQFAARSARSPEERRRIAEAMVGRKMSGDPLMPLVETPIPGVGPDDDDVRRNQFTYDGDPAGAQCPFGAHIRRANPRNADLPSVTGPISWLLRTLGLIGRPGDDLVASTRFHRLVRRGREYGPGLSPDEALQPAAPGEAERGLHFIGLNANISRQFEFIQNAWLMSSKFNGLTEESDPLLGHREPLDGCPVTHAFSLQSRNGIRPRLTGLPRFVTVRGGAYFFLPGLRALRYLAAAGGAGNGNAGAGI
jgi:deferrochelatase/peroxidase EfeB